MNTIFFLFICFAAHARAIDPDRRFQDVLGFGAALTDAATYLISRLPVAELNDFMRYRGREAVLSLPKDSISAVTWQKSRLDCLL